MDKRKFRYGKTTEQSLDLQKVYVHIDSDNWKRTSLLSLESLAGHLSIKVNDNLNVTSVNYVNQGENPELPPNTFRVNTRAHIAIDDNYLYVWVPSLKRWKRIILSSW